MKKVFTAPVVRIEKFAQPDVIATSGPMDGKHTVGNTEGADMINSSEDIL